MHKHLLRKKLFLVLVTGMFTLGAMTTALAAPHSGHSGSGHRSPRPNPIATPEVRVSRPSGPRHSAPPANYQRAHNPRPQNGRPGTSMNRYGVPTPHVNRPPNRPFVSRPHHSYPYWRRSNIVFRYGWPRASYWWGCRRGISFGEYLVLALMLESIRAANRPSMDVLYTEHLNGSSYEDLCLRYDLDWYSLQNRARLRYNQMHAYSTGMGIAFWGWSDRIAY